jgi:hypothetical protein
MGNGKVLDARRLARRHRVSILVVACAIAISGCGSHAPASYREARGSAACKTAGCEGHEAGWRWADSHRIADSERCGGRSQSFREGCIAYAQDVGKQKWPVADPPLTVRDALEECTPFISADGRSMLWFEVNKGLVAQGSAQTSDDQSDLMVQLTEAVDAIGAGKAGRAAVEPVTSIAVGTFDLDNATDRVTIRLPTAAENYTMLTPKPEDENGCLLVYGDLGAADLTRSWFGTSTPDEDDASDTRDPGD